MSYYAVTRAAGSAWADGGISTQPGASEHAAFMNDLAAERFVLFAGPLAGTEQGRLRALVIVDADSEQAIHERLAADPWARSGQLQTVNVEAWNPLVGLERL